jgi:hypothetical protein
MRVLPLIAFIAGWVLASLWANHFYTGRLLPPRSIPDNTSVQVRTVCIRPGETSLRERGAEDLP